MAKANVTYEQVAAFCDQQAASGAHPDRITCREVIAGLKCDSSTSTVSVLIKRWREEYANAVLAGVALSEADLGPVYMAVKGVVASKRSERERELTDRVEELLSRLKCTADDLEALMAENVLLTKWKDNLEGQLTEAKRTICVLQASLESIVGLPQHPAPSLEPSSEHLAGAGDRDAQPATVDTKPPSWSFLPPEAFDGSLQEPAHARATGQAAKSLPATAGSSNKGSEEKPHGQG